MEFMERIEKDPIIAFYLKMSNSTEVFGNLPLFSETMLRLAFKEILQKFRVLETGEIQLYCKLLHLYYYARYKDLDHLMSIFPAHDARDLIECIENSERILYEWRIFTKHNLQIITYKEAYLEILSEWCLRYIRVFTHIDEQALTWKTYELQIFLRSEVKFQKTWLRTLQTLINNKTAAELRVDQGAKITDDDLKISSIFLDIKDRLHPWVVENVVKSNFFSGLPASLLVSEAIWGRQKVASVAASEAAANVPPTCNYHVETHEQVDMTHGPSDLLDVGPVELMDCDIECKEPSVILNNLNGGQLNNVDENIQIVKVTRYAFCEGNNSGGGGGGGSGGGGGGAEPEDDERELQLLVKETVRGGSPGESDGTVEIFKVQMEGEHKEEYDVEIEDTDDEDFGDVNSKKFKVDVKRSEEQRDGQELELEGAEAYNQLGYYKIPPLYAQFKNEVENRFGRYKSAAVVEAQVEDEADNGLGMSEVSPLNVHLEEDVCSELGEDETSPLHAHVEEDVCSELGQDEPSPLHVQVEEDVCSELGENEPSPLHVQVEEDVCSELGEIIKSPLYNQVEEEAAEELERNRKSPIHVRVEAEDGKDIKSPLFVQVEEDEEVDDELGKNIKSPMYVQVDGEDGESYYVQLEEEDEADEAPQKEPPQDEGAPQWLFKSDTADGQEVANDPYGIWASTENLVTYEEAISYEEPIGHGDSRGGGQPAADPADEVITYEGALPAVVYESDDTLAMPGEAAQAWEIITDHTAVTYLCELKEYATFNRYKDAVELLDQIDHIIRRAH